MRNLALVTALVSCSGLLHGCQESRSATAVHDLPQLVTQIADKARANLVFIEGGTFTMGDFGAVGEDSVWRPYFPATIKEDQPHEVILSNYSLSKYKTTWADLDTYLVANGKDVFKRNHMEKWEREPFDQDPSSNYFVEKPARVTWQEAKDYCRWLGIQTDLPLDLPTSAQWEFAGRNRGSKAWIYSSHDGQALSAHPELVERVHSTGDYVPVGSRLPPNPLGIYDMADNGKEWVEDWFSETWYQDNPRIVNPQGPGQGTKKVIRNFDFSFSRIGMPEVTQSPFGEDLFLVTQYTFRCALQSSEPLLDGTGP